VTAHDWALFRQIMGASCSEAQLQEYIRQLQRPGWGTGACKGAEGLKPPQPLNNKWPSRLLDNIAATTHTVWHMRRRIQ
jgi:hypothetical protein